jgi:hypothetical protein
MTVRVVQSYPKRVSISVSRKEGKYTCVNCIEKFLMPVMVRVINKGRQRQKI